ncbi:hypothetical protein VTG60DRAFT_5023 [Thermothelomyces hinnuleus]
MKQKTSDPMTNPDSPWVEVRHSLGRLLSYYIAVKVFISARKMWPRLFDDFEVTSIPSSEPLDDPPDIRRNAVGIIKRMSRNRSLMEAYEVNAAQLQLHKLDDRIRERVRPGRFCPIVHAEINLLESVLASRAAAERGGEGPLRFIHEADFGAYIGTSKPTCLLCRLYFAAHPAGVRCRESHGNLYFNWRAPDVHVADGPEPERLRREILEAMVKEVRNEAGRAIYERSYIRKKHDSRDTPTNLLWSTTVGGSLQDGTDWASRTGQNGWDIASVTSRRAVRAPHLGNRSRVVDVEELASTVEQISPDDRSTRVWKDDDSRETTPEEPELSTRAGRDKDDSRETTPVAPEPPTRAEQNKDDDDDDDDDGGARL